MFEAIHLGELVATIVYGVLGLCFFGAGYLLIEWLTPFSLRKELEDDQNIAIGILLGALAIALAIIIAAAIT